VKIGYARAITQEQAPQLQVDALTAGRNRHESS
jgi:hypothetical protein